MSPSFWCLSVVTNRHASSDWSPGPVLVGVRLGACMRREWVVSGLCFYFSFVFMLFFDRGELIVFYHNRDVFV